jgi:2-keto-4-pentenoate hydratase/2-oxohepta-3-ene-1,7-dioic acid hydratase in catechol pathway
VRVAGHPQFEAVEYEIELAVVTLDPSRVPDLLDEVDHICGPDVTW